MSNLATFMNDIAGIIVGLVLTLFIFSYLLGDNPLYRLAVHILVGVSAAFAAIIVIRQVLLPIFNEIRTNPTSPGNILWLIPLLFALLLLLKRLPRVAWLGNSTIALLVGVGAAIGLVGAVSGTLLPQVTAVTRDTPTQALMIAILTVATLFTFQFTTFQRQAITWQQPLWQRLISLIGKTVLTITFGVLFASLLNTSFTLLTDRLNLIITEIAQLLP